MPYLIEAIGLREFREFIPVYIASIRKGTRTLAF